MKTRFRIILAVVGMVIFLPSLFNDFTWDDELILVSNPAVKDFSRFPAIITGNYFTISRELSYRPLLTALYFFQYQVFGLNAAGYHGLSVFIHILNSIFLLELLCILGTGAVVAFIVSIIFLVHPIQTEAVCNVSNQEDLLFVFFYLCALLVFHYFLNNKRPVLLFYALSLCFCSLLSKEMALTLPVMLIVTEHFQISRMVPTKKMLHFFCVHLPFWVLTGLFLYIRFSPMRNPLESQLKIFHEDLIVRVLTIPKVIMIYISKLLFPIPLQVDYPVTPVTPESGLIYIVPLLICFLWFLAGFRFFRNNTFCGFGLGTLWFFLTLVPVLNIYPIANFMAERFLYLPSIGIFLIAGSFVHIGTPVPDNFSPVHPGTHRNKLIVFTAVIMLLCTVTILRIPVWNSNMTLWSTTVRTVPGSSLANHNYGQALYRQGNYEEALKYYKIAAGLDNTNAQYYYDLGTTQAILGDFASALLSLEQALRLSPTDVNILTNLGTIYLKTGKKDKAIMLWKRALTIQPDFKVARQNLNYVGSSP